jgi:hypothetical protein
MAIKIKPATGLKNSNFVANTSRYINSPIIYWGPQSVITFETYKRKPQVFSSADRYLVIKAGEEYRPDLIAKRAYGTSLLSYWWKIMEANLIFDVFDLKVGLTLRVPPISS